MAAVLMIQAGEVRAAGGAADVEAGDLAVRLRRRAVGGRRRRGRGAVLEPLLDGGVPEVLDLVVGAPRQPGSDLRPPGMYAGLVDFTVKQTVEMFLSEKKSCVHLHNICRCQQHAASDMQMMHGCYIYTRLKKKSREVEDNK